MTLPDDEDSMGEMFNALKKARQEKRASNRESSAATLLAAGIEFESKNLGAHLIVGNIDFWPGTGLWIVRGSNQKRRGVLKLIKHIKGSKE